LRRRPLNWSVLHALPLLAAVGVLAATSHDASHNVGSEGEGPRLADIYSSPLSTGYIATNPTGES